ncbi:carbon-phosphorus lyase complex subunit PhnI [Mucilaginibacter polytrichastri]|uniref:Putative C-P lyase subunit protein htxH n=1 Tax=Mucilaginibacter polytrichastri TaxID=1302689 RepID=A0A1Q5ZZG1_9SPHI|nr:carbon-phosphorus lyase complex subunit PhnI [Mucilaginibacter polytrichastri]OKS87150.1 Putative C-P lyase subunit protein htxH [Mucilaginibacter polytrichastri]SFS88109.1 alpha-D-ribose 1-methylphosphonate 5-triphosphate synthase subunit PhnI [Mucilaginibacter polytrichastri]
MGYVAVKGGTDAIHNSQQLVEFYRLKDATTPLDIKQIRTQLRMAVDKVMGEGGVYAPEYAAIALKQAEGEVFEAAFILRAFRATLQRKYYSEAINTREMFVRRKISASFREIPGGQILGPTRDYTQRILDTTKAFEDQEAIKKFLTDFKVPVNSDKLAEITTFAKVIDLLKNEGLLKPIDPDEDRTLKDITREAIKFPAPRSARLQMLARAETGGLMALGYASMRGFGSVHPTVGELRYGAVKVKVKDATGRSRYIGKIEVTEAETISAGKSAKKKSAPYYNIGYGLCFGQNDTKVICMGILDTAMRTPDVNSPANDQEFVLYHTEGIESMGFVNHLKLPHYVTFQSELKNIRGAVERSAEKPTEQAIQSPQLQSV